ncbi:hypothetical protein H4R34_004677 [Dimargaris verticillata]|uniref:Uncharacterized protein n=1 Tax=Dimargaris verticillata TaxID=2761393 RepID=A0A9W8E6Z2_9FUNG|nr:hypothetical protein H4R34_004677 [Dimargaris verticillata]
MSCYNESTCSLPADLRPLCSHQVCHDYLHWYHQRILNNEDIDLHNVGFTVDQVNDILNCLSQINFDLTMGQVGSR